VTTRARAISDFLDGAGIRHELIEHPQTMTALSEARATVQPAERVAKTIVLNKGAGYVLATVPASHRLDLTKLRRLLGRSRRGLRLANEEELARDFPLFEVGATPPFGPMVPSAEVIDVRLMDYARILCPAGDHRHAVLVDPLAVVQLTGARMADICQG
jgi:Ala-tRNA(Pro) deacylase